MTSKLVKKFVILAMSLALCLGLSGAAVFADEEAAAATDLAGASIGGVTYYYADTAGADDSTVYKATVRSRAGSTEYTFTKADMTQVSGTDIYYTTVTGVTPLSGTLYGYTGGTATTYKDIYGALGLTTDESYDAVSSATNYTSHHAGDIPSNVIFGTDASGNKAITGLNLNRKTKTVDATAYVEAAILKAAGATLSADQEAALDITLKANPMTAPSKSTIAAKFGSAEYTTSKYGTPTVNVYPDDTVKGYVWNEYLDSIYGATISDGTTTVGGVYWIDLYGEKASTPGYHYNKVEFELNNGLTNADNAQTVSRYAAFFDETTGLLKEGTYTVSVYAEGYDTVTGTVTVARQDQAPTVTTVTQKLKAKALKKKAQTIAVADAVTVTDAYGEVSYTVKGVNKKSKKAVTFKDGSFIVKKKTKKGTYKVNVSVAAAGDSVYNPATAEAVELIFKVK